MDYGAKKQVSLFNLLNVRIFLVGVEHLLGFLHFLFGNVHKGLVILTGHDDKAIWIFFLEEEKEVLIPVWVVVIEIDLPGVFGAIISGDNDGVVGDLTAAKGEMLSFGAQTSPACR